MNKEKNKQFEYTALQKRVLEKSAKNVLVPASAGSGKTSVVIERVCRQICDGVDISELLVVTFTDAAAFEMLHRLEGRLGEEAEKNPEIASQIERLATADICTLHSFCKKLIKQYFFALNIDPSFEVCDQTQSSLYKAKALDEVLLSESKSYNADFERLIEAFDASRSLKNFRQNLLNMHEFLCAVPDRQKFLSETAYLCYDEDLNKNPAAQIVLEDISGKIKHFREKFENLLQKCKKGGFEKTESLAVRVLNVFPNLKNNFEVDLKCLTEFAGEQLPRKPALPADSPEYDLKEEYGEIKEQLSKSLKKIIDDYGDTEGVKSKLQSSKNMLASFLNLTERFEKEYDNIKRLNNCLDFCDLEKYAGQILKDDVLRESIQKKYKFVYVDEYQDINGVQEEILKRVSGGSNMIMVGDIKQSIYGFRNSDPKIFMDKNNKYQNGLDGELRPLSENFRSNPAILNFVNRVFEKVMTLDTCGIDYSKNRLIARGEHKKTLGSAVRVDIINREGKHAEKLLPRVYDIETDGGAGLKSLAQLEAGIVAGHIRELVDAGVVGYSNIAVLCRQRKFLKEFALELKKYKIPLFYGGESEILSEPEILLILSFLRLINNPKDDISLTTVLSSGVVGLSYDDLYYIKRTSGRGRFFEACFESSKKTDRIAGKLNELYSVLSRCRSMLSYQGIYEVLCFLDSYYHICDYYMLLPGGERRSLIIGDFISGFAGISLDLPEYLSYAERLTISGGVGSDPDFVKLDTIHSSKGLEFEAVFMVGLSGEFVSKPEALMCDPDMGVGISWFSEEEYLKDNTLARAGIETKIKTREAEEEMRLLYVGLTRAKSYLFMVAEGIKLRPMQTAYEIKSARSHFDYISAAFNEKTLERLKHSGVVSQGEGDDSFSVVITEAYEKEPPPKKRFLFDESDVDPKLKEQMSEYFEAVYPHENATKIAQKNSVTGLISAMGEGFESINSAPKALILSEHKTADIDRAKLGSAYHLVMQKLDFETASQKSAGEIIEKFVAEGLIEEKYAELIDIDSLLQGVREILSLGKFNTLKEQQFMSYIPYNQLVKDTDITDKVLLQGVIDLLLLGKENIIVDYKTTKVIDEQELCRRYKTQMELYKKAAEGAIKQKIDRVYIYSFFLKKLIEVEA